MSWYNKSAVCDDIAVSTRIRLARNLNGIPFPSRLSEEGIKKVNSCVKKAIEDSNTPFSKSLKYIEMRNIPENERYSMVERHILSPEFVSDCEDKAIIISEDESVCIMLCEEDHIRIQVIYPGLNLEEAYNIADSIDSLLCSSLDIAFDKDLGFLTECPTNLGTGLRASVMLHLPFLEASKELSAISDSISKIGFTVRGMYGEGTKAEASFYQISNEVTLGISEKNAIDNLKIIANQLIEKEKEERKAADKIKIADISNRALAILKSARILSSSELMKLLSEIKIGVSTGELNVKNELLTSLLFENQPYTIMCKYGNLSSKERDEKRAELIRERIKDI